MGAPSSASTCRDMEWEGFDPIGVGRLIPLSPCPYSLISDVGPGGAGRTPCPSGGKRAGDILNRGWHLAPSELEKGQEAGGSSCDHPPDFSSAPTCFPGWMEQEVSHSFPPQSLSSAEADEHPGNAGNSQRAPSTCLRFSLLAWGVSSPRQEHRDGWVRNFHLQQFNLAELS